MDTWRFSFLIPAEFWLKEALLGQSVDSAAADSTTNFISVDLVSRCSAIMVDCGPRCICRLAGVHETELDVLVVKYFWPSCGIKGLEATIISSMVSTARL